MPCRIAVDGPDWSGVDLAGAISDAVSARGGEAILVRTHDFLRPASIRLEYGADDPEAFRDRWFDIDALNREVLLPLGPGGSRRYLPTLWDADRDRATRASYRTAAASAVLVLSGPMLLGRGLDVDVTVHVALTPAARRRRVPPQAAARELPAFQSYDADVRPVDVADLVVRCDDPRHPAVLSRLTR